MDQKSGPRLLSTRNILGAVLVAGIAAGVYLGDFWKGFGWGGGPQGVAGNSSTTSKQKSSDSKTSSKETTQTEKTSTVSGKVVKVVIDNRSYFLRSTAGDQATELNDLVEMAKTAAGDEDGIRIRIYRKKSSRPSAEEALREALVAAGIPEEQTAWPANPVDD